MKALGWILSVVLLASVIGYFVIRWAFHEFTPF